MLGGMLRGNCSRGIAALLTVQLIWSKYVGLEPKQREQRRVVNDDSVSPAAER